MNRRLPKNNNPMKGKSASVTDKIIKYARTNPKMVAGYGTAILAVGLGYAALTNRRNERKRRKRHGITDASMASQMHRWS